jgi:hypothetical protein
MGTSHAVMNVTGGEIHRMILSVAGCDRYSGLIRAQYDWHKHGTPRIWVFGHLILYL